MWNKKKKWVGKEEERDGSLMEKQPQPSKQAVSRLSNGRNFEEKKERTIEASSEYYLK